MISIVVCSRNTIINAGFAQNIADTIGCGYELICIDNSQNAYSIFEAYNLGIEKSAGELICFLHDDIFLHTNGWGIIVNRIFAQNREAGLLGVAGSKIKTKMPSGWWNCPSELKEINILQHTGATTEKWDFGFKNGNLSEVAAIDGVFIVLRKSIGIAFNSVLKGFHNYDLNIAIECKMKGFKIFSTNEILIEHFSNGSINNSWYESTLQLHRIYRKALPLTASDFANKEMLQASEFENGTKMIGRLFGLGYKKEAIGIWLELVLLKPFSSFHLKFLKRIIVSKYMHK